MAHREVHLPSVNDDALATVTSNRNSRQVLPANRGGFLGGSVPGLRDHKGLQGESVEVEAFESTRIFSR